MRYITPEEEFWGHSSNLQAWVENNYDTRLLHRILAYPLLKKLTDGGDSLTKKIFKEEIAKRLESGYLNVVNYLINEGYLNHLNKEEIKSLFNNPQANLYKSLLQLLKGPDRKVKVSILEIINKIRKIIKLK